MNAPGPDAASRAMATAWDSIGARARETNLQRVDALRRALAALERGELSESDRRSGSEVAHQLVGSAGTFGFPEVSVLAREVEQLLRGPDPDPAQRQAAVRALAGIERDLMSGPAMGHDADG